MGRRSARFVPPLDQRQHIFAHTQIKYIGQTQAAFDGSSLDMPPSSTMAAKGVHPHLENLKTKVRVRGVFPLLVNE